jgi:hypothetical protein
MRERSVCACSKAGAHILLPLSERPHLRQANSFRIMGRILIRRRRCESERRTWNSSTQMKTQSSSFIYIMSLGANDDPLSLPQRAILYNQESSNAIVPSQIFHQVVSQKFETCLTAKTYFQVRFWWLSSRRILCSRLTAGWISAAAQTDERVA